MVNVGEYAVIRSWSTLFYHALSRQGALYLRNALNRSIEPDHLIAVYIKRVSLKSWLISEVITESDTYCLDDEKIILQADFYNTKALIGAEPTRFVNTLGQEIIENLVN